MAVQAEAWAQVGEKFETLGEHLRGHFDEVGTEASAERVAFEKSMRGLLAALEDGFGPARRAVRDPALREDVTNVATSVREALLASFETAGEQVRDRLERPRRAARPAATRAAARRPTQKAAAEKPGTKPAARKRAAG